MEFKVGDRVKHDEYGEGTVVEIESGSGMDSILVQFDKTDSILHNGNGVSKNGPYKEKSCWYFYESTSALELIQKFTKSELKDEKIKIEIKNKWTGSILFEHEKENNTVKNTVEEAIKQGVNLSGADLHGAEYNENTAFYALQCPETGSFIGYKICENHKIVKLLITEDSKRSSATTRKCRASKVKVLEITNIENTEKYETAISKHDANFIYEVGKTIEIENFDEDRWNECSEGIHFFITRDEAVQYD